MDLGDLFNAGTRFWTFSPQINLPIFQGDRLHGTLALATADRDVAIAQYEKSIQAAFREVADALALSQTLAEQRRAQEQLLQAAERTYKLSNARRDLGRDSFLTLLDAQRTLYASQQNLVAARLAEQSNRIYLFKALGGGWKGRTE